MAIKEFYSKSLDLIIVMAKNTIQTEYTVYIEILRSTNRINSNQKYEVTLRGLESELLLVSIKNYQAMQLDEKADIQIHYRLVVVGSL